MRLNPSTQTTLSCPTSLYVSCYILPRIQQVVIWWHENFGIVREKRHISTHKDLKSTRSIHRIKSRFGSKLWSTACMHLQLMLSEVMIKNMKETKEKGKRWDKTYIKQTLIIGISQEKEAAIGIICLFRLCCQIALGASNKAL